MKQGNACYLHLCLWSASMGVVMGSDQHLTCLGVCLSWCCEVFPWLRLLEWGWYQCLVFRGWCCKGSPCT